MMQLSEIYAGKFKIWTMLVRGHPLELSKKFLMIATYFVSEAKVWKLADAIHNKLISNTWDTGKSVFYNKS